MYLTRLTETIETWRLDEAVAASMRTRDLSSSSKWAAASWVCVVIVVITTMLPHRTLRRMSAVVTPGNATFNEVARWCLYVSPSNNRQSPRMVALNVTAVNAG